MGHVAAYPLSLQPIFSFTRFDNCLFYLEPVFVYACFNAEQPVP